MRPLTVKYLQGSSGKKKFKRWVDIVKHFLPGATDEDADFILWNETCFPFSNEGTLDQLYSIGRNHLRLSVKK